MKAEAAERRRQKWRRGSTMAAAEVAAALDSGGGGGGGGGRGDVKEVFLGYRKKFEGTQFIIAIVELNSSFFHHPTTPKHCVHLSTIPT